MRKRALRIGVFGQADCLSTEQEKVAYKVGELIAENNAILITGGRSGVMEYASKGAKSKGGITIGILPNNEQGNEYIDVPITTGLGLDFRSVVLVHTCDCFITIGGGLGTLEEISCAALNRKSLIVLRNSGGWSSQVVKATYDNVFLEFRRKDPVYFVDTAEEAVSLACKLGIEIKNKFDH